MNELRAWVLVVSKVPDLSEDNVFSAGDAIRNELVEKKPGFHQALEVVGPYDVVVEITGDSTEDLYEKTRAIASRDTVASTTTYVAARSYDNKEATETPNCCLLVGVADPYSELVMEEIQKLKKEVVKADIILGPFDMIVMARVKLAELSMFLDKLLKVRGIVRTVTLYELARPSHDSV